MLHRHSLDSKVTRKYYDFNKNNLFFFVLTTTPEYTYTTGGHNIYKTSRRCGCTATAVGNGRPLFTCNHRHRGIVLRHEPVYYGVLLKSLLLSVRGLFAKAVVELL